MLMIIIIMIMIKHDNNNNDDVHIYIYIYTYMYRSNQINDHRRKPAMLAKGVRRCCVYVSLPLWSCYNIYIYIYIHTHTYICAARM